MEELFMVLRVYNTVDYVSPLTGEIMLVPITNCAGFVKLYTTEEQAIKESVNGKYTVIKVQIVNEIQIDAN